VPERIQIRLSIDFLARGKIAPGEIFRGKNGVGKFCRVWEIFAG